MKKFIIFSVLAIALMLCHLYFMFQYPNWFDMQFGFLWFNIDHASLNLSQAIIERYISPGIWTFIQTYILEAYAWFILTIATIFFVTLSLSSNYFRRKEIKARN